MVKRIKKKTKENIEPDDKANQMAENELKLLGVI